MEVSTEVKTVLDEMYKTIQIHGELDWEVTLAGNGTNPCEAHNVMKAIYDDLGLERPVYTKEEKRKLIEDYGYDPADYE